MPSQHPLMMTLAWLSFCALWAGKSLVARRGRNYAKQKVSARSNPSFKLLSYLVFLLQLLLVPALFWLSAPGLLQFHHSDLLRGLGLLLCFAGLLLYVVALRHLGRNYSPCFDSHLPFEIIESGPYRIVRHPTWLAKILVSLGGILVGGSIWLLPILFWILMEMRRTVPAEEAGLAANFSGYSEYRRRTWLVLPFLF